MKARSSKKLPVQKLQARRPISWGMQWWPWESKRRRGSISANNPFKGLGKMCKNLMMAQSRKMQSNLKDMASHKLINKNALAFITRRSWRELSLETQRRLRSSERLMIKIVRRGRSYLAKRNILRRVRPTSLSSTSLRIFQETILTQPKRWGSLRAWTFLQDWTTFDATSKSRRTGLFEKWQILQRVPLISCSKRKPILTQRTTIMQSGCSKKDF